MFPPNGSVTRRPASLHRVLSGWSSPASTVLPGRCDSLRPSLRARLPSLGGTTRCTHCFAPPRRGVRRRGPRVWDAGCPLPAVAVETSGPLTFLRNPLCLCPALRPRRTGRPRPITRRPTWPPLKPRRRLPHFDFRGSITRLQHWLSTPRRVGCPTATQDSLPAAGPGATGLAWLPAGFQRKVSELRLTSRPPFSGLRDARFVSSPLFLLGGSPSRVIRR